MKIFLVYLSIDALSSAYGYGLGYVSSVLKADGHDAHYIIIKDANDIAKFLQSVKDENPGLVAFSATTCQFRHVNKLAELVKNAIDAFVVCGGVHPTLKPECLKECPGLDAIIRGEGEYPMRELARSLEGRTEDYRNIHNLWLWDKKRQNIFQNPTRALISDLDEIPLPDKSSLDYQSVLDSEGGINRFIFSRGCVFDCTYCANKALNSLADKGHYYRRMSPKKAIEHIESDASRFSFKTIYFDDDIICINKKWFYEFFELYKKKFNYPFYCNVRIGTIDEDMIKTLKDAGVQGIAIGIEQGNEDFRKKWLKRNMSNDEIIETMRLCEKHGVTENRGQVMIGLPHENEDLFLDSVRLCRTLNLKKYYTYIFHPYPGTELGKLAEDNGWMPQTDDYFQLKDAVIDYPDFSKENIQLCRNVFNFLVSNKRLPLKVPLLNTSRLLSLYDKLRKSRFFKKRKTGRK